MSIAAPLAFVWVRCPWYVCRRRVVGGCRSLIRLLAALYSSGSKPTAITQTTTPADNATGQGLGPDRTAEGPRRIRPIARKGLCPALLGLMNAFRHLALKLG